MRSSKVGRIRIEGAPPPETLSECPPLSPTLKSDGGNDAAAAAAVLAVRPPSTLRFRLPVAVDRARRIDGEAQLGFARVVKTIWESTTQTRRCVSLVAAGVSGIYGTALISR